MVDLSFFACCIIQILLQASKDLGGVDSKVTRGLSSLMSGIKKKFFNMIKKNQLVKLIKEEKLFSIYC